MQNTNQGLLEELVHEAANVSLSRAVANAESYLNDNASNMLLSDGDEKEPSDVSSSISDHPEPVAQQPVITEEDVLVRVAALQVCNTFI